jgi:aminoglycoside phosphotransferase
MRWFAEPTESALADALRTVAPELAELSVAMRATPTDGDPVWWSSSAALGDGFVAKFAWSEPAARRLAREIDVLAVLTGAGVPFLPEVVVGSVDPLLLVTRRVAGSSLFQVVDSIDRDRAGAQLAEFLTALHQPGLRERFGELGVPVMQPETSAIRDRLGPWLRPEQTGLVGDWCDWIDAIVAQPAETVLVHGDLHGDNQVWQGDQLKIVVDFETVGTVEPEFDLRALPGTGPGVELLEATMRHYTGRELAAERIMAWHLRTALGDALWRSEAGIHLPDRRTPAEWVDDLQNRLTAMGVG